MCQFLIYFCSCVQAQSQDTFQLPKPFEAKSVKTYGKVIGWPEDKTPIPPEGFIVSKFADSLHNPRWIYVAPNGDVFISEAGTLPPNESFNSKDNKIKAKSPNFGNANHIILLRDLDMDGIYESRHMYLTELRQPLGMLVMKDRFYVANTDGVLHFPYNPEDTIITAPGTKILSLPAGGYNNHWARNIIANPQQTKIYVSVGSASNNAEYGLIEEYHRANILEIDPDGRGEIIYAAGLRNPVGMDWDPATGQLWTAVNERDELEDEWVPDYATSVQRGGFYGWPYACFGPVEDPRMEGQRPDLVEKTIVPDIPLGAHTTSLGLVFYKSDHFPPKYKNGLFISQQGSWSKSELVGYKVVFVPFSKGKPSGPPEDFLTGFTTSSDNNEVHGRPVCTAVLPDGSLLVSDDAAKTIWQVKFRK